MRRSVQSSAKHSLVNALAIGLDQARTIPAVGKPICQVPKRYAFSVGGHVAEVHVRDNEIHEKARISPDRISMTFQGACNLHNIIASFERVKIVGTFTEFYSSTAELFQAGLVAQTHSSPVVTLQQHDRTIEMVSTHWERIEPALPHFSSQPHSLSFNPYFIAHAL